jgi:hypothetical protein
MLYMKPVINTNRQPPVEPVPNEYKRELQESLQDMKQEIIAPVVSNDDINILPALKNKLKNKKVCDSNHEIINFLDSVITYVESEDCSIYELTFFVCRKLERTLMKRKTGAQKKELAIKIVKHLFSNNEKVAGEFIELVLKDVPQVHFFRCNFIKFFNLFAKNE